MSWPRRRRSALLAGGPRISGLQGTDGRLHALADLKGPKGTLVMFICNHCPYVQAVIDRIVRDARELATLGVSFGRDFVERC